MPERIRELRVRVGTTFNTSFTAANDSTWNPDTMTDGYKVNATSFDASGLIHNGVESAVLQDRLFGASEANVPALRDGNLKFSMYLGKGSSSVSQNFECSLLGAVLGATQNPSTKSTEVDSATTTVLTRTGIDGYCSVGQCVLVGTKGDARGNGEVKLITATATDQITVYPACSGAPTDGDALVFSHTAYLDQDATQQYLDFLALGFNVEDQIQAIGSVANVSFEGLAPGEIPTANFECTVADWQFVPTAYRDQIEAGSAGSGNNAPATKGLGSFQFGDSGSTTRNVFKAGSFAVGLNLTHEKLPDANGINGCGGFVKTGCVPTLEFDLIIDQDFPGIFQDFENGTEKRAILQFGATANNCVAFTFPALYLSQSPVYSSLNNLQTLKVSCRAAEKASYTADLDASVLAIHWF